MMTEIPVRIQKDAVELRPFDPPGKLLPDPPGKLLFPEAPPGAELSGGPGVIPPLLGLWLRPLLPSDEEPLCESLPDCELLSGCPDEGSLGG